MYKFIEVSVISGSYEGEIHDFDAPYTRELIEKSAITNVREMPTGLAYIEFYGDNARVVEQSYDLIVDCLSEDDVPEDEEVDGFGQ
jgi:hypothetical protein